MSADVANAATTTPGARERAILLTTATLSQFGASVLQQGTIVLGVFFAATYHLSLSQMGTVLASATFGLMLSGLAAGPLVDQWGPRRVLFIGTLTITTISIAIALSPSLGVTMTLLFLMGLVLGTVPLSGTKAVLLMWPRERRGMPMGIRQMGVPLGALATALILPTLASQVGLHPIYFGLAVVVAICGLLFCAVLPSQTTRLSRRQTRLSRGEARRVLIPASSGFLLAWGQYTLMTYTIPMLHQDGVSVALAGGLLAIAQVGGAVARLLLGHISDRMGGRREHTLLGITLFGVALAVTLAELPRHVPFFWLAALWLALGAAFVGWNALAVTWAGERVHESHAGAAIGLETSAILSGATVSTPIFGVIVEYAGSYQMAWFALAAALAVAAVLLWTQARRPDSAHIDHLPPDAEADAQAI